MIQSLIGGRSDDSDESVSDSIGGCRLPLKSLGSVGKKEVPNQ